MPEDVHLVVRQETVKVVGVARQGPPGPGVTGALLPALAGANSPSPENPFATMADLPTTPEEVGAAPEIHLHSDKADLVGGKVPAGQLPGYMDDVLEYASLAAMPAEGEAGKIYVALDTNLVYRWSGTAYVAINPGLALGETAATAYRGDRGKAAYDHSQEGHAPANAEVNHPVAAPEQDADLVGTTPFSWPALRLAAKIAAKIAAMFGAEAGTICAGDDQRLENPRRRKLIYVSRIEASVTGTTSITTLKSYTLPAILGDNGEVHISLLWELSPTANRKWLYIYFGGVTVFSYYTPPSIGSVEVTLVLRNNNSKISQIVRGLNSLGGTSGSAPIVTGVDTGVPVVIEVAAALSVASETIKLLSTSVEVADD